MNYPHELIKLKIKAISKNLLLIIFGLFGMSMSVNAQTIASGSNSQFSLFLCPSGFPKACGMNNHGQLGDGTTMNRLIPVTVNELSNITTISIGRYHSLFLKNDGSVWASGENTYGQFGNGTTTESYIPIQVSGLSDITAIAGGRYHSLFLKNDGSVWASGWNSHGQLGDGTTTDRHIPVQVNGLSDIAALAAGWNHSLFLKNDGSVWASGYNDIGQLGDGTTTDRHTPVQLSGLSGITSIAVGLSHSLFLKNDGSVWATGVNDIGQLGIGTTPFNTTTPIQVSGLSDITAIASGGDHSLFLKNDGKVWASGYNYDGRLGDGTTTSRYTPVQVIGLMGITEIASGGGHSLFLKSDGSIWACGNNSKGQLGDGTTTDRHTPVEMIIEEYCGSVGVEEANNHFSKLSVFPNPANNTIVIESKFHNKQPTVKIYNTTGQKVLQSAPDTYWGNDQSTIAISSLSSGVYFIRLFDGENQSHGKFVKE